MADSVGNNASSDVTPDDNAATTPDYTRPSDEGAPRTTSEERRTRASWGLVRRRQVRQQWQEEFPYHWSADDLVTRRDTLRFLVGGSGALFLASAALAITGAVRAPTTRHVAAIAKVGEIPENGYKVFSYPNAFGDGIVVNLPGKGLVAYSDVCTHLSCAVLYQPNERQFYCPCHEGHFDAYTGQVLGGPPTRPLPIIELSTSGDTIYAVREVER
ncbi:MAG TPA: ubiquinol-cytochrome c reductase iron-sulfur subunit [Ktedonobacterales bacterium]|nr:ubiquinol-cytochrome c reductase iron-sulfur subunit [Ktedonobacterales bacterium]